MAVLQQSRMRQEISPRVVIPIGIGLVALLAVIGTGSALWMGVAAASLVGIALLNWMGPVGILYVYAALMWLLPKLYLPGTDTIIPMHLPLMAGAALLWLVGRFTSEHKSGAALLPPFWPLISLYAMGGFIGYFTGRFDIDSTNGLKFLVEACLLAPVFYLLTWQYMRSPKDAERLILLLAASTLALGIIAYIFQGSGYWTPIPFEKEDLRLSGQYQFGGLYLIVTPVLMSTQLSMLIPALTALVINSSAARRRIAAGLLLLPLVFLILMAAGRSGWMGTVVGIVAVVLFSAHAGKVSLPKLGLWTLAGLFLGALLLGSLGLVNEEISRRIFSFGTLLDDDTVVFRYWIWGIGIDLVNQYPLGVGFQVIRGLTGYPAHNSYILWALGTGVAGFAALVGFVVSWLVRMTNTLRKRYEPVLAMALAAFGGVLGGMISINGDNISTSVGWTQTTLWIMLGIGSAAYAVVRSNAPLPTEKSKVQSPKSKVQYTGFAAQSPKSKIQNLRSAMTTLNLGLWTLDEDI